MKASNAASAPFLVSAIQISWSARLAFDCWLLGSLFKTLAVSANRLWYACCSPDLLFSFSGTLELAQFAAVRAPRLGHEVTWIGFEARRCPSLIRRLGWLAHQQ